MAHLLHCHYHQLVLLKQGKLLVTGSKTFKQTLQYPFKDSNSSSKGTFLANTHLTPLGREPKLILIQTYLFDLIFIYFDI
jgi:hypothetical protein